MLTPVQRRALEVIDARLRADGVAPTRTELMAALDLRSRSGAQRVVDALIERGHLRRLPRQARALEVVRGAAEAAPAARPPAAPEDAIGGALALPEAQGLALACVLAAAARDPASLPRLTDLRDVTVAALARLSSPSEEPR